IVEEHVDPAEALRHAREGRRNLVFRRDVGVDVEDAGAELLGQRLPLLVLHVDTRDPCAGVAQDLYGAASDAAAAAGDNRDSSREIDHVRNLLAVGDATTALTEAEGTCGTTTRAERSSRAR